MSIASRFGAPLFLLASALPVSRLAAAPVGIFENAVDVGQPATAGSTTLNGSTYTMRGSGIDIGDGGDQLHFAYRSVTGDFTATIHITRRDRTPAGSGQRGRHGLMARWNLGSASKHSFVGALLPTGDAPSGGQPPIYQYRLVDGVPTGSRIDYVAYDGTFPTEGRLPTWMRITRMGNSIFGFLAEDADADGAPDSWCLVGFDSSAYLPDTLLVGVALQPQAGPNRGDLGTIGFDNASIVKTAPSMPFDCALSEAFLSSNFGALDPNFTQGYVKTVVRSGTFTPSRQGGRLRLTQDNVLSSSTAVWFDVPDTELLSTYGFQAEFDAIMTKPGVPGDVNPADGMTFAVIQDGQSILAPQGIPDLGGDGGGALGYGGHRLDEGALSTIRTRAAWHPSFAVEVDNWIGCGGEPCNDPFGDGAPQNDGKFHLGLDLNGEVGSVQTNEDHGVSSSLLGDVFSPVGIHVRVQYSPDGQIKAWARGNSEVSQEYEVLSARIPPLSGPLLLGFTGGTGAATCTSEVDNFVVSTLSCAPLFDSPRGIVIDLGNVAAGGDGTHDGPVQGTGIDPRDGHFTDSFFDGRIFPIDPALGGLNPSPTGSPYIDSVFFIDNALGPNRGSPITQSGMEFYFPLTDRGGSAWNYILKDRNGGVSTEGIDLAGISGFISGVGIHASMGITYDLEALRTRYGRENVQCFSTLWGLDECSTGNANLYAILTKYVPEGIDLSNTVSIRSANATPGYWDIITMPIPTGAMYLTLATGSNGNDNCDHGTFARALISSLPCPYFGSFTWLWSVTPTLLSTQGGQAMTYSGEFLSQDSIPYIGSKILGNLAFPSGQMVTGVSPPLDPGFYDAVLLNSDSTVTARLPNAIEVVPPLTITSVDPGTVSRDGTTPVNVNGTNFRPATVVTVGDGNVAVGPLLDQVFVSDTLITGIAPPLPGNQSNGRRAVLASDARGTKRFASGVLYTDPPPITIQSVSPTLVSTLGGAEVTFTGTNFDPSFDMMLGGVSLLNQVFVGATQMTGTTPQLPAGFQTAQLLNANLSVVASLVNAVEAAAPATVTSVTPRNVYRDGTTEVEVRGTNFRDVTEILIGIRSLLDPVLASPTLIRGTAPALDAGEPNHAESATARDSRGQTTLQNAVTYISRPAVVLASVSPGRVPVIGGSIVSFAGQGFAAGMVARIDGVPLGDQQVVSGQEIAGSTPPLTAGFHRADVTDADGAVLVTRTNALEAYSPVPGPQEVEASLAEGTARFSWFNPVQYREILVKDDAGTILRRLPGDAKFLELESNGEDKFHINLQGVAAADSRFSDISDGLAKLLQCYRPPPLMGNPVPGKLEFSVYGGTLDTPPARCVPGAGGGGGAVDALAGQGQGGGIFHDLSTVGYITTAKDKAFFRLATSTLTNTLTTGFVLDRDADKLEIAGFYQKIAAEFGLSLRGKLRHVYPADGFEDEFTFPDLTLGKAKDWNSITYFRSDRDVGDPLAMPCAPKLKIPKGDYLLDIYAVNGDGNRPYYVFTDDGRDNELLIQGSPCPPYPMVTVKDLTGYATLPLITSIVPEPWADLGPPFGITVKYTALGYWLDEDSQTHSIKAGDPTYIPNDFEYTWKVHDRANPSAPTSSINSLITAVRDWGCWEVEITVKDKRCGFQRTYTYEVPLIPFNPVCATYNNYLYPTPEPSSIYGVVGLSPGPGHGTFSGKRPADFRILVVPNCFCNPAVAKSNCPSPQLGDFEVRLAYRLLANPYSKYVDIPQDHILDLCKNTTVGPKYFKILIDDIGGLPNLPFADGTLQNVRIEARTLKVRNPDKTITNITNDIFHGVGNPMHLTNAPKSLGSSYWSGGYEKQSQTYHFITNSSRQSNENFDVGPSRAIPLPLPGIDIKVPSFDNSMNSGLTSRFKFQGGVWAAEEALGTTSGQALGNTLDGAPLHVQPTKGGALTIGEGGGGAAGVYEWCTRQKILDNHLKQTLFESILFTGSIGPIPVTVWASISLSLDITMDALVRVFVSPFAPLEGGKFVETDFYLLSKLQIAIPCSIRADILFGIASIAATLKPQADINLDAHIGTEDLNAFAGLDIGAYFSLYFEVKACINVIFTDICFSSGEIPVINHETIIHKQIGDVPFCVKDSVSSCTGFSKYCTPGGGGGEAGFGGFDGQGGIIYSVYTSTSAPVSVSSPDKLTTIDSWIASDGSAKIYTNGNPTDVPSGDQGLGAFHDPAACFLSNSKALIAWTKSFATETSVVLPLPTDTEDPRYLPDTNTITAQDEIVISPFEKTGFWIAKGSVRIADPVADVPDIADRRADGRPSMAADLPREQAMVAWVRYETHDFLAKVDGETTRIYEKQPNGSFNAVDKPTIRAQLDHTAIYTRRVGFTGPIGPARKISPAGINIEPVIAFSPSGNVAYCLWVHDSTHKDLVNSNLGRSLLYSVYTRTTDSWSAAAEVFPLPDNYPGLLEPAISLKADGEGLAVFTALDKGTSPLDSGLSGGSRYVYTCRLEGGVFGPPVRIHGKCQKREYGHWATIHYPDPVEIDPLDLLHIPHPDWVIIWQETGEIGSREGSGNIKASVLGAGMQEFTNPVTLTKDENIHSNVTASIAGGKLHTINLNLGPARRGIGAGAGGGVDFIPDYETHDFPLRPDLSVASATLSDPFSAPGSTVVATVEVENLGLSGSPYDNAGNSAVGIRGVYIDESGGERVMDNDAVPILQPGEKVKLSLTFEMPHDPVRLRIELSPNPHDTDSSNDSRVVLFGAPMPKNFVCDSAAIEDYPDELNGAPSQRLAVILTWENAGIYDQIQICRDGACVAAIPGNQTSYLDIDATAGLHEYAVRGVISVSKSVKSTCDIDVSLPGASGKFLRGDTNGDGTINITDAIVTLSYLFTGGRTPGCLKASDTDDSGVVNITDPILALGFLFLGGRAPAPPHPACGFDPTTDNLVCETQQKCQ